MEAGAMLNSFVQSEKCFVQISLEEGNPTD